ncbi:EAL domain-containing protein [Pseudomonas sp. CCI1.2]|uniref:EAL domain-containing protein n=1 Tax=Pseudomonas sp. CCI1.2 TaxID=3048614 RepID=UPI002B225EE2|nr:EAL domain-containing protein [Pseudomonas sp. CCI1.2]MEB0119841.1 EAL domain-containing protein [Pseudomonas sp. CCI1.2]
MESLTVAPTLRLSAAYQRLAPQSLRAQFTLALLALALLIAAGGATAVYALRSANNATRQLTQERLMHMQAGQDMLQNTLLIERQTDQLLTTTSFETLRSTYLTMIERLEAVDYSMLQLTDTNDTNDGLAVLDLHQSSQLFRNTANVVAQLREGALQSEVAFDLALNDRTAALKRSHTASSLELAVLLYSLPSANDPDAVQSLRTSFIEKGKTAGSLPAIVREDLIALSAQPSGAIDASAHDLFSLRLKLINQHQTLQRFHDELQNQARALVHAARVQSGVFTQEYRVAVEQLVDASTRSQRWILIILAGSLLIAGFVARVFMGRRVLVRLNEISRQLRQGRIDEEQHTLDLHEQDEIGAMAGAVSQFLSDRQQLESRTAQLSAAQERLALQNTQLQQEVVTRTGQSHVLELIATSTELEAVLDTLARVTESQLEGMMVSILLLDEDGEHLQHGAAPSLPDDYCQAINGVAIGPCGGSCGTAVYRRESVIVSDIEQDPLWADYRELATTHGIRSCWSTPIFSREREVLGTFALYSLTERSPTTTEIQLLDGATQLAGIAIERKHTENRIRYMGDHDALTGLPNRLLLEDRLKQAIIYAQRFARLVTVAFIDLDKFKLVNDSLGHSAGDELLKTVANRMVKSVRRTDTVVRLGGDEFVIILFDQPSDAEDITSVLQNIQESILQPIHLSGHTLHVTCSMGLATYPADGIDTDTLLRNADAAMYRSKEMGRNGYQFYTDEMNTKHQGKLALQDGLRNAIENDEFLLLYQPQLDLHTGEIIGVEALIRWQHPELGLVSPIKFISQAEETGLIVPIGDWVIHSACRQTKAWQDAGLPPITMSVNISARQFIERDLIRRVEHALKESGLEPMYLELELTESLIMQDLQQAISKMEELQAMGIRLSIDDFGTGYSSLAALKSFPIVRLKIDQSFIRDLPENENDKAIATAVISLGHKLNLKVIAEGVETEAQKAFLRDNGCDEMQGYLFSKPVFAREIEQLFPLHGYSAETRVSRPRGIL